MNKHDPIVGRYVYVTCQGKTYRTYYEENGEGIPLVCLPLEQMAASIAINCDPDISANFRTIVFDVPRHGKSLPPAGWHLEEDEYKLQLLFRIHIEFCRALELHKPVIMGQSMGGNICELALDMKMSFGVDSLEVVIIRQGGGLIRYITLKFMVVKLWPRQSLGLCPRKS